MFGLAASVALNRQILPRHFTGGLETTCFRRLEAAGYQLVLKSAATGEASPLSDDDLVWCEGDPLLVTHLRRERGRRVSDTKRAAFIVAHGRLFCERCGLDPRATFGGPDGDACIEVHHRLTPVAAMAPGHQTRIEDLECLCANCHRVVHRRLKVEIRAIKAQGGTGKRRRPST